MTDRAEALAALEESTRSCVACGLADARVRVVVGGGAADADLLIVGESPGFHEERGSDPFSSDGGALLAKLLEDVGIARSEVYVTTLLKCRPPATRDPDPLEIAACEPHLFRQIELVRPTVVATLGTVATRVLSGRPHGITAVNGRASELTIGAWTTTLLPLYHPAAALYTPAMRETLERDIAQLPRLLGRAAESSGVAMAATGRDAPADPSPGPRSDPPQEPRPEEPAAPADGAREPAQLGLF
jgi:DNA polymerase